MISFGMGIPEQNQFKEQDLPFSAHFFWVWHQSALCWCSLKTTGLDESSESLADYSQG